MKRLAILLLLATPVFAAEKWLENYNKGVTAVNGAKYKAGADALAQAIAERPSEGTSIRSGNQIIAVYTPHFFLGIAKFNLGDVDGALREWKISEEQGAITRTEYYANLKDWVARAQTEKQRNAQTAASVPKKSADAAISRALALQVDALSAGGDRTESYRNAQRKLQEAMSQFQKAGTSIDAYKTAETTAGQAIGLFTNAAEEGKKLRAAAAARPPAPKPAVIQPKPAVVQTPPPAPVKSEAEMNAEIAVQSYSRDVDAAGRNAKGEVQNVVRNESRMAEMLREQLANAKSDPDFNRIAKIANDRNTAMTQRIAELNKPKPAPAVVTAQIPLPSNPVTQQPSNPLINPVTPQPRDLTSDLRAAYRAFAGGDLASAEATLNRILDAGPSAEAHLLRGCARYTRAMLSRSPDALLAEAQADFKAALAEKRFLRLDPAAFSPKLVAFFEQVRNGR
ncbi:MAG TPA: hypothetical protein VEU30_00905 [Thermoanaerobaculia bacterium]|nr:hypothetical protein [Thermoanaerobaculia bacterium]